MLKAILKMSFFKKAVTLFGLLLITFIIYPKGYFVLERTRDLAIKESSPPYSGVISYIINLDRAEKRYHSVEPLVSSLGYHVVRISAIDGALLSENEIRQTTNLTAYESYLGHTPKQGMIGCNLSHLKAWKSFLQSTAQFALIFEDDVSFDRNVLKNTVEALRSNANLWDIVNLESRHRGHPVNLKYLAEAGCHLCIYFSQVSHAGAYLINLKTAVKIRF